MLCPLCGEEYYGFAHYYDCPKDPRRRVSQDYDVLILTEYDKKMLRGMLIKWD